MGTRCRRFFMCASVRQIESSCVSSMVGSQRTVSEDACIDMTAPRSDMTAFIMQFVGKMPRAFLKFLIHQYPRIFIHEVHEGHEGRKCAFAVFYLSELRALRGQFLLRALRG